MTLNVRARLTNEAADAARATGEPWLDNPDLKALATLYHSDPLVAADDESYVLSASELDALEDAAPGDLVAAAATLLERLNGAALLVLNSSMTLARLTGQIQTSKVQTGTVSGKYWVYGARDFTSLDPASCAVVLTTADGDPQLDGVLMLLGNRRPGFTWFDLWRVWEVLRRRAENKSVDFRTWVGDQQRRFDFERSANDPGVSGSYARHGVWAPRTNAKDPLNGLPIGQPMSPADATAFIHGLVRRWVEEDAGQLLVVESPPTP